MQFSSGSRVQFRGLSWEIAEVVPLGEQQLLRLRCLAGDLAGLEWEALHPVEDVQPTRTAFRPEAPGSLQIWRLLHTAALLEQSGHLMAIEAGRIEVAPYQLVPLMRALELPRVRLMLADGVGLGKTIQACLIITELIARRAAHRVLIITPAGPLLAQWNQELRQRFGLRFTRIADAGTLQAERRRLELGANPFEAMPLCLMSLDFAKQDLVLQELERVCWDLVIVDEAHHCVANANEVATQRRLLAETVAQRADGLLLLTATPHDGFDPHFASLMALLDPSLVDGGGALIGQNYRRHIVRRLKPHLRDPGTGSRLFRDRRVLPVPVVVEREEVRAFHRGLAELIGPKIRSGLGGREERDALAFISLLKRSVSTISACLATLRTIALHGESSAALRKERQRALRAYRRRLRRYGYLGSAAEDDLAELEAEEMAAQLRDHSPQLAHLITCGERAASHDPKLTALIAEIRAIRARHPDANALVYSEYIDSAEAAIGALMAANLSGEVLGINGQMAEADRIAAAERFSTSDRLVLVSTDSMAEGLNLHQRCFNLIHLDLPYNPNRLEQRNGRIDRYGQTQDAVIRYLYLAGTFEQHLLLRLIAKHERARSSLGAMPDTLGVTAEPPRTGLMAGFAERQEELFAPGEPHLRSLETAAEGAELVEYRELLREIGRAYEDRAAVRHGWMPMQGLSAEQSQVVRASKAIEDGNHVDLPRFVAEVIAVDTGRPQSPERLELPESWRVGLEGLPGCDLMTGVVRVTRDHSRFQDDAGSLAFLGRAHPLVQRAVRRAHVLADSAGVVDGRVAVGRSAGEPALLFTFLVELRSARQLELQQVLAVRATAGEVVEELSAPSDWIRTAEATVTNVWPMFLTWGPRQQKRSAALARKIMQTVVSRFNAEHRLRIDGAEATLRHWASLRATEICGPPDAPSLDLFRGTVQPAWRTAAPPRERLAALAGDGAASPGLKREAASVLALVERQARELEQRRALHAPAIQPLGLLLLIA